MSFRVLRPKKTPSPGVGGQAAVTPSAKGPGPGGDPPPRCRTEPRDAARAAAPRGWAARMPPSAAAGPGMWICRVSGQVTTGPPPRLCKRPRCPLRGAHGSAAGGQNTWGPAWGGGRLCPALVAPSSAGEKQPRHFTPFGQSFEPPPCHPAFSYLFACWLFHAELARLTFTAQLPSCFRLFYQQIQLENGYHLAEKQTEKHIFVSKTLMIGRIAPISA